jgi:alcohol dehydrogenase class IV|tara:strand:- start:468 stop:731 length:264 start_codon:yes stop_codon:yes gene_type:complete
MISPINPNKILMTENIVDRDQLQAAYINRVLDDMDIKDMMAILYDYMDVEFDKYTVDEMIEQVEQDYPDMLDDSDNDRIPDESTGWN